MNRFLRILFKELVKGACLRVKKITLKSEEEIKLMVEAGRKLAQIRDLLLDKTREGLKTIELDRLAEEEILSFGGQPSFKTVRHFPYTTCISINEEVVHGLPGERVIQKGDVVKVDLGMIYGGLHTDTTGTTQVKSHIPKGFPNKLKVKSEIDDFLEIGKKTLEEAIKIVKHGNRIGQISQVIQKNIEGAGYSVVKVLTGHGIGRVLHEEPAIPQFLAGRLEETEEIVAGMTFAIEVIYNMGKGEVAMKADGWTIVSEDGKISATFEKSVAVSKSGVIILTP